MRRHRAKAAWLGGAFLWLALTASASPSASASAKEAATVARRTLKPDAGEARVAGSTHVEGLSEDADAVLDHLNSAIGWYRHVEAMDRNTGEPSDRFYLENARAEAVQAVQLAFQVAQAQASLQEPAPSEADGGTADAGTSVNGGGNNMGRAMERIAQRISATETEIDAVEAKMAKASRVQRSELTLQKEQLEAELDLVKAQQEAIQKITTFMSATENAKGGLEARIEQLKGSVPEIFTTAAPPPVAKSTAAKTAPPTIPIPIPLPLPIPVPAPASAPAQEDRGLIGQASMLFSQLKSLRDVDELLKETQEVQERANRVQAPLRATLRATMQHGKEVADAPTATDRAELEATRKDLETITAQFKHLSSATVPLRQEMVLLEQCHANLSEWRVSIRKQYGGVLRQLITHAATLLAALLLVAFLSNLWRRATFRYVADARRRRQLQLLRRFVTGFLMAIVLVLGFVSEFGSLATFAGFITAGIAVALQTVILSIAAYFFLIGRYGLRVGDRITVSGVTGDVLDVGLVRLYLMELAGTGVDLYPTGRVVVFSNSVLFQATPLFKQLPGTEFVWHEVSVSLNPNASYGGTEQKMLETVNRIYAGYKQSIEQQHREVERLIDFHISVPAPTGRLQFTDQGLECQVRYPVEMRRASEIDDQVTRALMEAIAKEPELKASVSGPPRIRSAIRA